MDINSTKEVILDKYLPKKFENIKAPELDTLGKIVIGKIIQEYPEMIESYPIRYNIYLAEKDGEYSIVLRWTNILPDGNYEPEYYRFNMKNVEILRDILDDALKTTGTTPLKKNIK